MTSSQKNENKINNLISTEVMRTEYWDSGGSILFSDLVFKKEQTGPLFLVSEVLELFRQAW